MTPDQAAHAAPQEKKMHDDEEKECGARRESVVASPSSRTASQRGVLRMLLALSDGLMRTSPFDPECAALADRHYSRRTIGARQFAYNGRKLVLRDAEGLVLFVWMFPKPELRMDGQTGYNNAIFRNESARRSSEIILEAEGLAVEKWGPNRAYTYIDPSKVKSVNPGYCFKQAGWTRVGYAKDGKHLLAKDLR